MTELYWMTILGQLNRTVQTLLVISIIITFALGIGLVAIAIDGYCEYEDTKAVTRWFKVSLISVIVLLVLFAFIPSKKDAYVIYGIGGTIDYIKSNSKGKLPDKYIYVLDKVADEYSENNNQ